MVSGAERKRSNRVGPCQIHIEDEALSSPEGKPVAQGGGVLGGKEALLPVGGVHGQGAGESFLGSLDPIGAQSRVDQSRVGQTQHVGFMRSGFTEILTDRISRTTSSQENRG